MSTNSSAAFPLDTAFLIISIVQFSISIIGLPMNSFLIFCMMKNKELRATCCTILIFLLTMNDWFSEFLMIAPSMLVFFGTTISVSTCFPLGTFSYFVNSYASPLISFISFDRLISLVFPTGYIKFSDRHKWKYLFMLAFIPFIWMSPYFYISYLYIMIDPNRQVFCMPTDTISPFVNSINFYINSFCNVTAFLIYLCIWMLIKCKVIKLLQNSLEQRVLKSLSIIMVIVFLFGVPPPLSVNYLLPYLQISAAAKNVTFRAIIQLTRIIQAVNFPVLYFSSYDFHAIMKKELMIIFGRFKINTNGSRARETTKTIPAINNFIGN